MHYKYDNDNNSNKLLNVTDETSHPDGFNDGNVHTKTNEDDFEYDDYGNLIKDKNKKINEVTYNHLNLPKKIIFDTGEISYLYDATGVKLKKTVTDGSTSQITNTHYSGGFQYTEDHLDFFPHAEGYVNVLDYSAFNYVYTYKDHLGNIRLKYTLDPDTNETAILEENHYYPYGLTHQGYNADHKFFFAIDEIIELVEVTSIMDDKYKYKFNGMEWQDELDLNHYDFGARNYDAALGRWMNIDPYMELMRKQSPYNYAFNNPVYFADYNGGIPWPVPEMFLNWARKNKPDEYFGFIKSRGRNHNGLDLNFSGGGNTDLGAPVLATHSGKVARIIPLSANDAGGRIIVIESPDGSFQTKYMHLSMICVQPGDEINEGMTIGLLGGSGFGKELAYSAHLHYEIHRDGKAIDPWDKTTNKPLDPQTWIPQTGPLQDSSSNSEQGGGGLYGIDLLSYGVSSSSSGNSNSSDSSSNQSNNSPSREPVTVVASGLTAQSATPVSNNLPNSGGVAPIAVQSNSGNIKLPTSKFLN